MGQAKPLSPSEDTTAVEWAEVAELIEVRPDGSWEMTDFAKDWFEKHPPQNVHEKAPLQRGPVSHGVKRQLRGLSRIGPQSLLVDGHRIARQDGGASFRARQPQPRRQ